jgi:restriction endonuclease Mrr
LPRGGVEPPPPLAPADLDARLMAAIMGLSPAEFENFCGLLLERMGYTQVRVRGKAGDGGIDLTMYHGDTLVIAQCKRYQNNVGAPALREFYGTLVHSEAAHGFFITTSDFTPPAREWIQGKPITLINGARLLFVVRRYLLADVLAQWQ